MSENNYYLDQWASEFGNKYTERCDVKPESRKDIFKEILKDLPIESVLEIGCNKGHNLEAIDQAYVHGVEPNEFAIEKANKSIRHRIVKGNIYDLPYIDESFDLVFTSGVLIHIPSDNLYAAIKRMRNVAKKYVLMIEYPGEKVEGKEYRDFGYREGCWSRPYGDVYQANFGDELIKQGKIRDIGDDGWGFSDCDYWLFEKK